MQAAARIDLRTVLPFKLPAWTRSLGLAVLLLCCALLVPAQHAEEDSAPAAFRTGTKQTLMPTGANADGTVSEQMPHIQVISPEDVQRLLLTLTDDRISLEEKAKLLAQLNAKTANLPRSELPPALQDAMAEVEKELASRKPDVTAPAGARQTAGTGEPAPGSSAPPAAANAVEIREIAMALIQHNFSDVQEPLERYYRALAVH